MITRQDLLEAIAECQGTRSPNASTAVKLAAFYTILDHLDEKEEQPRSEIRSSFAGYSLSGQDTSSVTFDGDSDFARTVNGQRQADVWPVLDELMSTIKLMNERLYYGVIKKLSS